MRGLGFDRASVLGINPFCYAGKVFDASYIVTPSDNASIVITSEGLNDIIMNRLTVK